MWQVNWPLSSCGLVESGAEFYKKKLRGDGWDELARPAAARRMQEVLTRNENEDPVKGVWPVSFCGIMNVWCDASKIAYGVVFKKKGKPIEDGSWLRKLDDGAHINLAELNAVIKGVNMAMK